MAASLWSLAPLLWLILGTAGQDAAKRGVPPQSPCPAVYSYGWDPAEGWYGIITILPPARFSEIQLVIRLTVPAYKPELGVGRVEVKGGTREIQAISNSAYRGERHKIQYLVIFPPFDEIPKLKELYINGYSFCKATEATGSRSTIELKYVLKSGLNLPLAHGSEFSAVTTNKPTHSSRPDVITIAIIETTVDEARPLPSSKPRPAQSLPHRPCDVPTRPTSSGPDASGETNDLPHKNPVHTPTIVDSNSNVDVDVDDKIIFVNTTTGSDHHSSRVVSLLESLVTLSKKRYQVELERLEIEKKRLTLEKVSPKVKI